MQLYPYLSFDGNCEEALKFYSDVFGGKVTSIMHYSDAPPDAGMPPGMAQKVMHSTFVAADITFMAADAMRDEPGSGTQISLSISGRDVAEGERIFQRLSEGGHVVMPMADTFWGARFGIVHDRFGIPWMINCEKA